MMKKHLAWLAAGVAAVLLLGGGAVTSSTTDPDYLVEGCVISLDPTLGPVPSILADLSPTHYCWDAVTGVSIDANNDLRIDWSPAVSQVVDSGCDVDETLAQTVTCGPSVGLDNTTVSFFAIATHAKVRPDNTTYVKKVHADVFVHWVLIA